MPRGRGSAIRDEWMQFVRGSVTESAAATFTQSTVNLPVVVAQGFVIEVHTIEFTAPLIPVADLSATDDALRHSCQLTKSSQTAQVTLSDPATLAMYYRQFISVAARTAEGKPVVTSLLAGGLYHHFPVPLLIPFEEIFFGAQSIGGSAANTYAFRIGYKTIKLATSQLVELLQAATS